MVLFFRADRFSGGLRDSEEGHVFWLPRSELPRQKLASDMMDMVRVFEEDGLSEFSYFTDDGGADDTWRYRLL